MIEQIKEMLDDNKDKILKFIKEYGIFIGMAVIVYYLYKLNKDN
jgi:hypothetical protein